MTAEVAVGAWSTLWGLIGDPEVVRQVTVRRSRFAEQSGIGTSVGRRIIDGLTRFVFVEGCRSEFEALRREALIGTSSMPWVSTPHSNWAALRQAILNMRSDDVVVVTVRYRSLIQRNKGTIGDRVSIEIPDSRHRRVLITCSSERIALEVAKCRRDRQLQGTTLTTDARCEQWMKSASGRNR